MKKKEEGHMGSPCNTHASTTPHTRTHPSTPLTLFEGLFQQQWLQAGVQLFTNILNQDWSPKLNTVLQCAHVVWVGELHYLKVVLPLRVLHPLVSLPLRVNH